MDDTPKAFIADNDGISVSNSDPRSLFEQVQDTVSNWKGTGEDGEKPSLDDCITEFCRRTPQDRALALTEMDEKMARATSGAVPFDEGSMRRLSDSLEFYHRVKGLHQRMLKVKR